MYWGNGMGGWGMVLMTVIGLLFWALVIVGIVALVRYLDSDGRRGGPEMHRPTPQQTLAERFARGNIDEDEYIQRLQVLDTTTPTRGPGG
ncbi:MAG TPA: hypothetical protein VF657_21265 [Actinoplanes sp.]|jgi:putative membrane protein